MKKIIFAAILMVIAWSGFAQETIFRKNSKGVLESVEFPTDDKHVTVPATAEVFFKEMLGIEPTDEFRKIDRKQRQEEFVHEHFEQYYKGIKVEGGGYNFHYKNNKMYFAHGHYINISDIDIQPAITKDEAMKSFAIYKKIPLQEVGDYHAEIIIKEIPTTTDTIPLLVYKIYLYTDYRHNSEIGFVDAHTGEVVFTEPALIDFSEIGTFETRYSATQQGIAHHYQGGYHLVDSTRGAIIHTWNLEGRTDVFNPIGITSAIELMDNDNNWTQAEHRPSNNDMGLDVQWALQGIYDRLYNTHNINSMDDDGFTINAYIRDGYDPDNAFWSPARRTLSFGEGGLNFRSLASVDVVAHEFGHGITHFQIGWGSSGDPHAFNEGMSDIWGIIMEHRIRPNSVWQIGEQLTKNYNCLRDIQNTNASNAMTKIANTFGSTQYNSGDSYVRSGVFSHWYYLLVNGATGTNDLGRKYTVHGVGMDLAEELIVKAVYDGYLRFTNSYAQIRTSMINAAREIAGTNSFLEHQVANAWYAVGVGNLTYKYSISGPSHVCSTGTSFVLNNLPVVDSIIWKHGPYLTINSGQNTNSVVIKATNNGSSWITVKVVHGSSSFTLPSKNIWAGMPVTPTDIIPFWNNGMEFGNDSYYEFRVTPHPSSTYYTWQVDGGTIISGQGTNWITVKTIKIPANVQA
ncbi:MAG: M4 family metallopeptidase, partial [Bacteroidales bacterium]|nr:M4 family metallopeptidase [Bacteroidales bacterium]